MVLDLFIPLCMHILYTVWVLVMLTDLPVKLVGQVSTSSGPSATLLLSLPLCNHLQLTPEHRTAVQPALTSLYRTRYGLANHISQSAYYCTACADEGGCHWPSSCANWVFGNHGNYQRAPPQQLPHMLPVAMMNGLSQGAGPRRHCGTTAVIGSFVPTGGR